MTAERNRVFRKRKIGICLLFVFFYFLSVQKAYAAEHAAADARNGIVEVQSGFVDAKGNFQKMKSGSGFLIRNEQNETYIITNNAVVSNSVNGMKKFSKKNKIDTENLNLSNEIHIVVKGDVAVSASVLVKSVEQDYCILSTENVLNERKALKLGSSKDVQQGEEVYALGFPEEAENMEYSPGDVEIKYGKIVNGKAQIHAGVCLQHSIPVSAGNTGGPLLNERGYVIGLNCRKFTDKEKEAYYAVPIDEMIEVLNNFSIYFGSESIDAAYEKLDKMYQTCLEISVESGYTKDSVQDFTLALQEAGKILEQEMPAEEDLTAAYRALTAAEVKLAKKMSNLKKAIIIFAVVDVILFLWFLIIFIKNISEEKRLHRPQTTLQPVDTYKQESKLKLFWDRTGETAVVNTSNYVIGADPAAVDYCLSDNEAVSGRHAVMFENNGSWYIDDLDSLNGTYVNNVRVVPGRAVKIQDGDEIVLANETCLIRK